MGDGVSMLHSKGGKNGRSSGFFKDSKRGDGDEESKVCLPQE